MSANYTATAALALQLVGQAGAPVTFTLVANSAYNPLTDVGSAPVTTTLAGFAVQTRGDPVVYSDLELIESEAPTLIFTPATYTGTPADVPILNALVTWNGLVYGVRWTRTVSPSGSAILTKLVIAR